MIPFTPIPFLYLGPLPISTHGLMFAIALLVANFIARRKVQRRGWDLDIFDSSIFWGAVGGFIGTRLLYVIVNFHLYRNDFWGIFRVWEGGLISFGGLIGGVLTSIWYLHHKKISTLPWLDMATPYIFLGWSIGRIGNFLPWEIIGTKTTLPWGIIVGNDVPRHPVQLYSSLGLLIIAGIIGALKKRFTFVHGVWFGIGMITYGLFRFTVEFLRDYETSEYVINYRTFAQTLSILLVAFGIGLILRLTRYRKHV